MIDYQPLYEQLSQRQVDAWLNILPDQISNAYELSKHGSAAIWLATIQQLSDKQTSFTDFDTDLIKIGQVFDIDDKKRQILIEQLKLFHPWRKGPYEIYSIHIDTEWRSDWKWNRLKQHIAPLKNKLVLDVGCGNGYHCWRMLGAGAKMVVGIEPLFINVVQFQVIRKLAGNFPVYVLPIGLEQIPQPIKAFDSVFSMGVLYHRRSPIDHLMELKDCLRPGGELILETLVIEGKKDNVLIPEGRYAKMRNVWFLPSCDTLIGWMQRCGFINCRVIDINITSIEEQRTTEWMQFHSLKEFLDPNNPNLTCEGLPAPKRALLLANT